jgi:16S rRNA (guanine(966)-N(2))-methyltransferase RsmD
MRIISGEFRGRRLDTLPGLNTRPTSEKAKEALFSIIQFEIEGRKVLDLFAGSGQLGLEALSRGARECVFVEADRAAAAIVKANIERCEAGDRAKLLNADFRSALRRSNDPYDIIFIDPPYESAYREEALGLIDKFDILSETGIIIIESDKRSDMPETVGKLIRGRQYLYGKTRLTLYRRV